MSKPTTEEIFNVIDAATRKNGKVPLATELMEQLGLERTAIQPHLMSYISKLKKLRVLPNGKIEGDDRGHVWVKNSAGSLSLARYKEDPNLGNYISG